MVPGFIRAKFFVFCKFFTVRKCFIAGKLFTERKFRHRRVKSVYCAQIPSPRLTLKGHGFSRAVTSQQQCGL